MPVLLWVIIGLTVQSGASGASAASAHGWSVTPVDPHAGGLSSISCPSVTLCVAVDRSLHVVWSTRPSGPPSGWLRFEGRGWPGNYGNPDDYFGTPGEYTGVSCASPRLCVAVDNSGDIVASENPAGGRSAWHGALVDCGECLMAASGDLSGVSCTSAAVCVGADPAFGDYATARPLDPDSWMAPADQTTAPYGISCGAGGLCVQFGRGVIVTSLHPSARHPGWHQTAVDAGHNIDGLSCPRVSLCIGVDHRGDVLTSTDPAAASPQWNLVGVDGTTALEAISCPTARLCVAVDNRGHALISTDPTGGQQAWRIATIDGHRFLTAISCASASLCVAVDESGDAVTSTNPSGQS